MATKPTPPSRRRPPAKKATKQTSVTSTQRKDKGQVIHEEESHDSEILSESILNPAHVTVGGSFTKNLGNYESVKITVQLTRPCFDEEEEIERVYAEATEWVGGKIDEQVEQV